MLDALIDKVRGHRLHEIVERVPWHAIRKYEVGGHEKAEHKNVLALALKGHEKDCDAVVFVRDQDGHADREAVIEAAIREVRDVAVVGGVAIRTIDAWCLAMRGSRRSEEDGQPKQTLEASGVRTTADRVACVRDANIDGLPRDARSLSRWLARCRAVLGT